MIGTVSVEVQAANPSLPLFPLRAFINSPTSLRIRNVPKKIGDWSITKVYVSAAYPDNSIQSTECKLIGGVWVGTIAGSSMAGRGGDGYTVYADGIDENGEPVAGYILGKGEVEILSTDTIAPEVIQYYVHLLEDGDIERHLDGDLWKDAETGAWLIWQDGQAWAVGDDTGLIDELKERVDELDSTTSELSVNVSDLNVAMEGVGERLDAIDSTVSGLVDELGVVDGKVSALESDVEAMASRIIEIDSSVSELQANVQTLDDELDTKADASELENYATKVELQYEVDEIDSSLSEISANVTSLDTRVGAAETSIVFLDTNINGLGVSVANLKSSVSAISTSVSSIGASVSAIGASVSSLNESVDELDSTISSLSDTKADKVKGEQVIVDIQVPQTIQYWNETAILELSSELREQDPQDRVWWVWYDYIEEFDFHFKGWVCYDPTADANGVSPAVVGWNTVGNLSGQGHMFPWEYGDGEVEQLTMWGDSPDDYPTRQGMPPIGYDYWHDYFASQTANRKMYAAYGSGTPYSAIYIYGWVTLHILPETVTYNVIYEDDMNEALEDYAPLQKQMSYEGDVLVPNQIDSGWVSITPAMARLGLNASYMSQDTQKRVWWSSQVQYEPEPSVSLYIYVVACYDATNDTFKANIWRDQQEGLPQNLSDLDYSDEWGSFTRASGWASWRDFFYNAPEDEYEVSYGQTTDIELFDHAFVNARWGGLFDVVYEGELVNAYATRQYVDEQIGNVLTEEF